MSYFLLGAVVLGFVLAFWPRIAKLIVGDHAIRQAVEAEREACAKVAEYYSDVDDKKGRIAAAIRSRSKGEGQ